MVAHVVRPTDLIRARPTAIQHGRVPLFRSLAFHLLFRVFGARACVRACICTNAHASRPLSANDTTFSFRSADPAFFLCTRFIDQRKTRQTRKTCVSRESLSRETRARSFEGGKKRKAIFILIVRLTCQNSATCSDVLLLLAETNLRRVTVVCSSRIRRSTPSLKSCQRSRKH